MQSECQTINTFRSDSIWVTGPGGGAVNNKEKKRLSHKSVKSVSLCQQKKSYVGHLDPSRSVNEIPDTCGIHAVKTVTKRTGDAQL